MLCRGLSANVDIFLVVGLQNGFEYENNCKAQLEIDCDYSNNLKPRRNLCQSSRISQDRKSVS